jgi:Uncharacterised nucleotidyltransferase
VNRWEAFVAVCDWLREGLLGSVSANSTKPARWERIINVSSQHFVTPALAWCLKERPGVPPDISAYFNAALMLNARRNELLLAALARVATALNARDTEPILLKGAARLVDGCYPEPSLRFLGDLDVLVPAAKIAGAAATLKDIGFEMKADDPIGPSHHHLPMLRERDSGVGIELHKRLADRQFEEIVPTAWFLEHTVPLRFRGARVRLADATRAVAHNIVHDQLVHSQHQRKSVELRQLLDFSLIRARYDAKIDWSAIDHQFCDAGMGQVLSTYVDFARVLFAQRAPQLSCAPGSKTIDDFRRRMGTWQTVRRLANDYVDARRREPLGIIRLFSPRTWSNRIRLIKTGFESAV